MITLKIPYSSDNPEIILDLSREFSCVVRFAYNRFLEGHSQKEIRNLVKSLSNISSLNSWFVQCAIMEANAIHKRNKNKKVIFGGSKSFFLRLKNKITHEEIKDKRTLPISIQGEKLQKGNRSFDLSSLSQNKVIFKVSRTSHIELKLQKMKSNYLKKLTYVEQQSNIKDLTVSVKLSPEYIYLSYNEPKESLELNNDRHLGIDLNPNNIGISIKEGDNILYTKCYDLSKITSKLLSEKNSSDSIRFKYLNNKLKYETLEVSKDIESLVRKYSVKFVFIEDLKNLHFSNMNKGHKLNRLTKNLWKRDYFVSNLNKRMSNIGVKVFKVNPMYSSVIGNLQHSYFDPINASLEIGRRGYNVIISKNKQFYPSFFLKDQWKEYFKDLRDWKELFRELKNSKLRYRVSLDESNLSKVFQMKSIKSKVLIYEFK
jgi:IS605 OrfB family transposase